MKFDVRMATSIVEGEPLNPHFNVHHPDDEDDHLDDEKFSR
jgi:hypothetical protein